MTSHFKTSIKNFQKSKSIENKKKYSFNYVSLALVLAVFTSGHVLTVDALGLRLILQITMIALILTFLFTSYKKKINKKGLIVIYVALSCVLSDLIVRQDLNDILGYALLISLTLTILLMNPESILKFIGTLNYINCFFASCSIIALLISINSSSMFNAMFDKAPYYSSSFLSGIGWQSLLGHADTEQLFFGLTLPRISAHLQQASLVPAYFLLPLAISLAFISKNRSYIILLIILFSILSTGGNTYVAFAMTIFIYTFAKYIPQIFFTVMPFVLIIFSSSLLVYLFIDTYDADALKEMSRSFGESYESASSNQTPVGQGLGSGIVRLALMGYQTIGFIENFPLPANSALVKNTIGGNLMTNGLRGGVIGFLFTSVMYYILFHSISQGLKQCKPSEKKKIFGFSLMYALIFQSFIYNDFGFSTYYGYTMFAIIIILSSSLKKINNIKTQPNS